MLLMIDQHDGLPQVSATILEIPCKPRIWRGLPSVFVRRVALTS